MTQVPASGYPPGRLDERGHIAGRILRQESVQHPREGDDKSQGKFESRHLLHFRFLHLQFQLREDDVMTSELNIFNSHMGYATTSVPTSRIHRFTNKQFSVLAHGGDSIAEVCCHRTQSPNLLYIFMKSSMEASTADSASMGVP